MADTPPLPPAPRVVCAVLHLDGNGDTVPCPGYPESGERPCYVDGMGSPHDAHERNNGQGWCPGFAEPDDGIKEPAPPQTVAEQVRDLERIIERVREAVGTDMVLVGCEQHEARIAELEQEAENLRGRAEAFEARLRRVKAALTDALGTDPLRDWDDITNAARALREDRQDRELDRRDALMDEARAADQERRLP